MKTWIYITIFLVFCLISHNTALGQQETLKSAPFQKEWADTFKVELQPLMEIAMEEREAKDIMITSYQYEEGTITTEFREFDLKKITDITNVDIAKTDFEKCMYRTELEMTSLGNKTTQIAAKTIIKVYGKYNRFSGVHPGWWTLPSNGVLEKEILRGIKNRKP